MYKKNFKEAAERNKLFLKRKLTDEILFIAEDIKNYPYMVKDNRDETWKESECLSVSEKEWVIESCRRQAKAYQDIDDDSITSGYPTFHFGESFYSTVSRG